MNNLLYDALRSRSIDPKKLKTGESYMHDTGRAGKHKKGSKEANKQEILKPEGYGEAQSRDSGSKDISEKCKVICMFKLKF